MAMVSMNNLLNGKDSRWLQLEVCREFQRNKCTRPDTECKFAHPPANVEVQNGRVTACYDSIKVTNRCIIEFSYSRVTSAFARSGIVGPYNGYTPRAAFQSEPAHGRSAEVPYWLFTIGQAEHYATVPNPGMRPVEMPLNVAATSSIVHCEIVRDFSRVSTFGVRIYFLLRANYKRHRALLFSIEKSVEIRVTKENNFFLYWVDSSFTFLFARNKSSGTIQQADCKCEEIPGNSLHQERFSASLKISSNRSSHRAPLREDGYVGLQLRRAAVAAINMNTASFFFARAVNSIHSEREWCLGALQTVIARERRKQKTVEDA
ncbi:Protein muscleblind [Cyphomyrmex costatus]|uniref:Protein muscleblind n=1 Tax=Cyphomyrmex costatus TaxID=456900 RepID=A0A195D369_9HYME|nr:Protein muscleblind [Cyphomyrmex costatus]